MLITPGQVPPNPYTIFLLVMVFITGLCIGSFLNVVALRFLADMPVSHPGSHCPQCKAPIRPYDNIPVLGWLLLGGRCRACKAAISTQYPLVELTTGALFLATVWVFGFQWTTLLLLFLISNLVVIFVTDWREKLIFEINSLSLIPAGLLYNCLQPSSSSWSIPLGSWAIAVPDTLLSALAGIIAVFVFFEGLILFSRLVFGTDGFGHGDTHLMMGAAAFLGWQMALLALLAGFITQSIPAIPMLVVGWIRNRQYISLISGGVSILAGCFPLLMMSLSLDNTLTLGISFASLIIALIALLVFMKNIRNSATYTYLPLGPALIIGILAVLFFEPQILSGYLSLLIAR